jgi:Cytochrome c554 and c-prime
VSLRALTSALPLLLLVGAAGLARAAARDWIGSAACGRCHPQQFEAWRATSHARTFRIRQERGGRCVTCHSTGEAPAGPVTEFVVGCEACHGAGADYSADDVMRNRRLALDLGLSDLSVSSNRSALCANCHAQTTLGSAVDLTAAAHPLTSLSPSQEVRP